MRPTREDSPLQPPKKQGPQSHLDTDHLLQNIGHRALSGGAFTAGSQGVRFVLNLGSAVILARLMSPGDFGLVSMAGALMPLLRAFREGGLSTATVQKESITNAQVSNLFWINVCLGAVISLLGVISAPLVAWFYHDDRVIPITVALSLAFLLSGSSVQHLALLNRQMRFRAIAIIEVVSSTAGFIVGVFMAWRQWAYWSLVGMQLTTTIVDTGLTWLASKWVPQMPSRGTETKSLLRFGASLTINTLLQRFASSADAILLGRFYGPNVVGLYSRAQVLLLRPLDQFMTPFDTVFVPILSRLQSQPDRYRQVFLQAYGAIALLSFIFIGLLAGLSAPVVLLLLGPQWSEVIPIFSWLTLAALYIPLNYAATWLLTTQGRGQSILLQGVLFPILIVAAIAIGLPMGPTGVAISLSMSGLFIRLPIQYYITGRSGPVSTKDLWGVLLRHLPLWAAVGGATWLTRQLVISYSPLVQCLAGGFMGVLVAVLSVLLWPSLREEALFLFQKLWHFAQRFRQAPA